MSPFQEIEHTADWALHVWAPSLESLFVDAARGMFHLAGREPSIAYAGTVTPLAAARPAAGQPRQIELSADGAEGLLVAWLHELLYLSEAEGLLCGDFAVERLTPTHLAATVWAWPSGQPEPAIKAVAYHNLAIRRVDGGYSVALTFDV